MYCFVRRCLQQRFDSPGLSLHQLDCSPPQLGHLWRQQVYQGLCWPTSSNVSQEKQQGHPHQFEILDIEEEEKSLPHDPYVYVYV